MRFLRRLPFTTAVCISITPKVALRSTGGSVFFANLFFLQRRCFPVFARTDRFGASATNSGITYGFRLWSCCGFRGGIRNRFWTRRNPSLVSRRAISLYFVIWLAGPLVERLNRARVRAAADSGAYVDGSGLDFLRCAGMEPHPSVFFGHPCRTT